MTAMANVELTPSAPLIRRIQAEAAAAAQRCCHSQHYAWFNTLQRVRERIARVPWRYADGVLNLYSPRSSQWYRVSNDRCAVLESGELCKAFAEHRPCWHRAAHVLVQRIAREANAPEPVSRCATTDRPVQGRVRPDIARHPVEHIELYTTLS